MADRKKPFHKIVAENLIEQLKAGTAPWQKSWEPGEFNSYLPMNPVTSKRYKGINSVHLMSQGRNDTRWMTYKQAQSVGAQVQKGEKGTTIAFWKFNEEQIKLDENGKPVLDSNGDPVKVTVALERPRTFFATVFNAEQIDGLPPIQHKERTWDPVERGESILKASGANILHREHDRAFYRLNTDTIHLPDKGQFPKAEGYYATVLHELGHWTGHPSRLDRDLSHPFGSENYAKEELRAEIASMILGDEIGLGHDTAQHAAYVKSWINILQNDPLEIFRASADAEKIQNYVLSLEQKQVQNRTNEVNKHQTAEPEAAVRLEVEMEQITDINAPKLDDGHNLPAMAQGVNINVPKTNDYDQQLIDQALKTTIEDNSKKIYIAVPYKEKDEAKTLGARWDRQQQSWYIPQGLDPASFVKWTQGTSEESMGKKGRKDRIYLAVPYGERIAAKAAGALWDKAAKSWYAGPKAKMEKLQRWLPDNVPSQQMPAMDPREEFADALRSMGCIVTDEHPVMDGNKHRIVAEGDKKGEKAGFYVGYIDGHPAGYIKNNRTGIEMKWKSKGYCLDPREKAKLQAEAANKLAERAAKQEQLHEAIAQRIAKQMKKLVPVSELTTYMHNKDIQIHAGVMTDKYGRKTYIPAFDANGKLWTMQYIKKDSVKRFAKDSKKEGCFHPVGGFEALAVAPVLVIAEGYATSASLAEVLGHATISAFDSGNLVPVAKDLHDKYPDKPIIIAGDDDRGIEIKQGINPGRVKAEEAATAVGGKAIFPIFAPGEQDANPVAYSDFNDLATKSLLGKNGIERQVKSEIGRVTIKADQPLKQKKIRRQQSEREMRRAKTIKVS